MICQIAVTGRVLPRLVECLLPGMSLQTGSTSFNWTTRPHLKKKKKAGKQDLD